MPVDLDPFHGATIYQPCTRVCRRTVLKTWTCSKQSCYFLSACRHHVHSITSRVMTLHRIMVLGFNALVNFFRAAALSMDYKFTLVPEMGLLA